MAQEDSVILDQSGMTITGELESVVLVDSAWHPNPKKATMLSAAFPGAGQIYNRQWWKAPIIYAGLGTLGYFIYWNNDLYQKYSHAYDDFTDDDPNTTRYLEVVPKGYEIDDDEWFTSAVENRITGYRRDRDYLIICAIGVYALNIIEANVAANLHDFDVSDDLSLNIFPELNYNPINKAPTLGLSMAFNINK